MTPERDTGESIQVEVAYAEPQRQFLRRIELPRGATIAQALAVVDIAAEFGIALAGLTFGIWSKPATAQSILHDGDRVELYRPLKIDPKEARRLRAGKLARRRPALDDAARDQQVRDESQPP